MLEATSLEKARVAQLLPEKARFTLKTQNGSYSFATSIKNLHPSGCASSFIEHLASIDLSSSLRIKALPQNKAVKITEVHGIDDLIALIKETTNTNDNEQLES